VALQAAIHVEIVACGFAQDGAGGDYDVRYLDDGLLSDRLTGMAFQFRTELPGFPGRSERLCRDGCRRQKLFFNGE